MNIQRLLNWIPFAALYLIGYTLAAHTLQDFLTIEFWYSFFYFLIPANVLLNSLDNLSNTKYAQKRQSLLISIAVSIICSLLLIVFLNTKSYILFLFFLALIVVNKTQPLRLKTKPILDVMSSIFYVLPGFIGYIQLTNQYPADYYFALTFLWIIALQLFCTIAHIEENKKNKIMTTATLLGEKNSLIVCALVWMLMFLGAYHFHPIFFVSFAYPAIAYALLLNEKLQVTQIYKLLPTIIVCTGLLLFIYSTFHLFF